MTCMDICPPASELSVVINNIVCPEQGCGQIFKASSLLNMHLTKHHRNECLTKKDTSVIVRYFCPEENCIYHLNSTRHFTQMKYLKQHYLKVHSIKKFVCKTCSKGFATEDLLQNHFEKCGIKFTCSCGNNYKSYEALLTHSKRKQHMFDEKYRTVNKRSKANLSNCLAQPIYILPKGSKEPINGLSVNMLAAVALTELSKSCTTSASDKAMQTDYVDARRKKAGSPPKSLEKPTKRKASAQTQTSGFLKNRRPRHSAETQTVGDCILKKAMEEADILYKGRDPSLKANYCRKRRNSAQTQTTCKRTSELSLSSLSQLDEFSNEESIHQLSPSSPNQCYPTCRDIGLPDLWLSQKNTSSTQTGPIMTNISSAHVEDENSNNTVQADLNLEFFCQDNGLGPTSNIQSLFEDNSDSFDNVVGVSSHFDSGSSTGNMTALDSLSNPEFSCNNSCNIETQTDRTKSSIFVKHCQESDNASFTLSSTIETQTTDDLCDLDTLLYSNMCTQTCDDNALFSDLDFVDIETQTAWPYYNEESNESALVSTETQTAISSCGFSFSLSENCGKCLISDASNHETQTSENDLKDIMAELDDQDANKQLL